MAKLHELLAVDTNLSNQANTTREGLMKTFADKRHLFTRKIVKFLPNDEAQKEKIEAQSDIQTSVKQEVTWLSEHLVNAIDVGHQVDVANTQAHSDVVLEDGDEPILKNVPATSLLQLEKRIQEVMAFVKSLPTHDPAQGFTPDPQEDGLYVARTVTKNRTSKEQVPLVLYPATDKHPAQTQLITKDVVVGTITEQEWSAMTTPVVKSDILANCEKLLRAVKKARARANQQEIETASNKIGKKLLDYVFQPLMGTNGSK